MKIPIISNILEKFGKTVEEDIKPGEPKKREALRLKRINEIKGLISNSAFKEIWEKELYSDLFNSLVNFIDCPIDKNEFYKGQMASDIKKILSLYSAIETQPIAIETIKDQLTKYRNRNKPKKNEKE